MQPWRAAWLLSVFAAAGLALCSVKLWRGGPASQLALAFLYLAWIGIGIFPVALLASLLALGLSFLPSAQGMKPPREAVLAVWGIVALCALLFIGMHLYALMLLLASKPEGAWVGLQSIWTLNLLSIPICLLAVWWANTEPNIRLSPVAVLAAFLLLAAFALWDDRQPQLVASDQLGPDPALQQIIAARPGDVLWPDGGFATWTLAGRPNWVTRLQGAGAVFSRTLAAAWDARTRRLIALGPIDPGLRAPFSTKPAKSDEDLHLSELSDARLERLCAAPDAPSWIMVPAEVIAGGQITAERWKPSYWTAPVPQHSFDWDGQNVIWRAAQTYGVPPCSS
jgi:hypothetical protein